MMRCVIQSRGRDSDIKKGVDARRKTKFKPPSENSEGVAQTLTDLLRPLLCGQYHGIFCKFLYVQPFTIHEWPNILTFRSKHESFGVKRMNSTAAKSAKR